ncbi:type I glutamate--ammonia ligase [Kineosporia babensis]|uniref:Glutamine synthetase family protein n=1 Tax=Kineosporia babensis TaxID=499548 RepID=A0A9X1NK91_9ACTN|nr:glutamine synthetase family protein [Kineosporia babensis]MCD5315698.1 glutamine synthetase family protein [Kineosporia babensis]
MTSRPWSVQGERGDVGRPSFVAEFGLWDERQRAAAARVEVELAQVDLVRVAFCDPHGLARSKTVPAQVFRRALHNGMDFSAGPFLFDTGHAVALDFLSDSGVGVAELRGAGNFVLVPDPTTFQILPGREPRTAWVLGDEFLRDGTAHPLSARQVLRRTCQAYERRELSPVIGLELEWHLTRLTGGPPPNTGNGFGAQGPAPAVQAMNSGYQFNLDSHYDSVAEVVDPLGMLLLGLGLPLRTMEHESGPGQIEMTVDPLQALDAADALLLMRTQLKQACRRTGHHASFMTLPRLDSFDPSGWHLHQSVASTKEQRNILAGAGPEPLSQEGRSYLDGLLSQARELCLLSVPTVNGYRRMDSQFTLSPTTVNWSPEDRSAMVRLAGAGAARHLENRVAEPCANPYLAIAAQLSAGLDGLARGAGLAPGYPALPTSLREALEDFRTSPAARSLLGAPLQACLTKLKESEAERFENWCTAEGLDPGEVTQNVTEWEHREYFAAF